MITLVVAFYIFVVLFSVIGSMRGWGKEVLVSFSVILALAFITVFEELIPYTGDLVESGSVSQFWLRTGILGVLVFLGYQSPKLAQFTRFSEKRDRIQDILLGILFGAINGYLIFGTIWYFMNEAAYPFTPYISSPINDPITAETAQSLLNIFPPAILTGYWIYVAVVVAFIFVLAVFV